MQGDGEYSGKSEPNQTDDATRDRRRAIVLIAMLALVLAGVVALVWSGDSGEVTGAATTAIPGTVNVTSGGTGSTIDSVETTTGQQVVPSTVAGTIEPTQPDEPPSVGPIEPPSEDEAVASVDRVLAETIDAIKSSAESVPGSLPDLTGIATGALLGELEAVRAEYNNEGWSQIGAPEIVGLRVVQPPTTADPNDAVVEVCLDNSAVRIVDKNGVDVREPGSLQRVLNLYVLTFVDGRWVASDHTFPDDTTC